jgi:hypothetical protein
VEGFSYLTNGCSWPKGELTDTEIQAQFGSALERKAAISQLCYITFFHINVVKCQNSLEQ